MSRAALSAVLLLLLGGTAWWLLAGSGPDTAPASGAPSAEQKEALEPGRLAAASAPGATDALNAATEAPQREAVAEDESRPVASVAWFRGRLRVISGTLAAPPTLSASLHDAEGGFREDREVPLAAPGLSFEVPAAATEESCLMRFPDHLEPVAAAGGATLADGVVTLSAPADGFLIDVAVKPHLAVQFLHDPSGEPLAHAEVTSRLSAQGGSTSWGERLDAQGMLVFDLGRRRNMEEAEFLSFTISRPPDVGSSESARIPCADLDLLPQPLILRFASTPQLQFRVLDPDRNPVASATARLGGQWTGSSSDEEGRVQVLQSAPPAEVIIVEATGFLSANEPVTAASSTPAGQDLTLWPSSWILIVGEKEPPDGWGQLDVKLLIEGKRDGSLLPDERFQAGRFTESSGNTGIMHSPGKRRYEYTTAMSAEGRVKVDGIHVDVPATVFVTYRGVSILTESVPIRPGDGGHELKVPPLPELLPLRGRVTDLGGRALAEVEVRANFGERDHLTVTTDESGEFELGGVPAGASVAVVFHRAGFGRRLVEQKMEARDEDSMGTIVLAPGRSMTVHLLDASGTPFVPTPDSFGANYVPRALVFGQRIKAFATTTPGEWQFRDLPEGEIIIIMPGEHMFDEVEHLHDTAEGRVTFTLDARAVAWLTHPADR